PAAPPQRAPRWSSSMTTPRVTVPPYALEAIAFNLCSLHDFDVAFVRENERFATAVITEYVRTLSAAPAPEGGVVRYGVYVASRASAPERPAMWRKLRDHGHPIISTWIDEAGEGESHDLGDLWGRILREV